jgi:omega-amidase
MRIAIVSLDQKWQEKENILSNCKKIIQEAANNGCNLIIFPEMTLTGFLPNTKSL